MSVYYEIKEHLVIEDTEKHSMELGNIHYRLSLMAAWTLQRRGCVGNLTIIADGEKFSFTKDILNTRYQDALNALYKAKTRRDYLRLWLLCPSDGIGSHTLRIDVLSGRGNQGGS